MYMRLLGCSYIIQFAEYPEQGVMPQAAPGTRQGTEQSFISLPTFLVRVLKWRTWPSFLQPASLVMCVLHHVDLFNCVRHRLLCGCRCSLRWGGTRSLWRTCTCLSARIPCATGRGTQPWAMNLRHSRWERVALLYSVAVAVYAYS